MPRDNREVRTNNNRRQRENDSDAKLPNWTNPALYKTRLCDHFRNSGTCKFDYKCWFAHGRDELRSVPRLDRDPEAAVDALAAVIEALPPSRSRIVAMSKGEQLYRELVKRSNDDLPDLVSTNESSDDQQSHASASDASPTASSKPMSIGCRTSSTLSSSTPPPYPTRETVLLTHSTVLSSSSRCSSRMSPPSPDLVSIGGSPLPYMNAQYVHPPMPHYVQHPGGYMSHPQHPNAYLRFYELPLMCSLDESMYGIASPY